VNGTANDAGIIVSGQVTVTVAGVPGAALAGVELVILVPLVNAGCPITIAAIPVTGDPPVVAAVPGVVIFVAVPGTVTIVDMPGVLVDPPAPTVILITPDGVVIAFVTILFYLIYLISFISNPYQ
jgi:hypothetical protein